MGSKRTPIVRASDGKVIYRADREDCNYSNHISLVPVYNWV